MEAVILLIMSTWVKDDVGLVNVPLHLDSSMTFSPSHDSTPVYYLQQSAEEDSTVRGKMEVLKFTVATLVIRQLLLSCAWCAASR